MRVRVRDRLLILGSPSALLLGCVLGHAPAPTEAPQPREEPIPERPPECRGPGARCTFFPGYWHYDGASYVWVSGRWEPRTGLDLVSDS